MVDFLTNCFVLREDQKPSVIIKCGKLTGRQKETKKGREYISFTSVPYAEPPIGKYRNTSIKATSYY